MTYRYDPSYFEAEGLEQAKWIILNPDDTHTTEERWGLETDYLVDLLKQHALAGVETCLDYGCGVGRLAKRLVEQSNVSVIGADISAAMCQLAPAYVDSPRFLVGTPESVDRLVDWGLRVDLALAVWALQHSQAPRDDIARIHRALRPGGRLFVVNSVWRFVPVVDDEQKPNWLNDGVDIWAMLNEVFGPPLFVEEMDKNLVPSPPSRWGVFER